MDTIFIPTIEAMNKEGRPFKLSLIHISIGIDAVAMCVNDVICCGAKPLFFLDYIAIGKNYPEKVAEIVSGIAAVSYTHLDVYKRQQRLNYKLQ